MNNPLSDQKQLTLRSLLAKLDNLKELQTDPELQLIELQRDEVLFEEGDEADGMYIVVAGVLGVRTKLPDGTETIIDKLAPGATVGELAVLSGQPRTATVFAINNAGLIHLSQSSFEQMTKADQGQLVDIDKTVVERWRRLQLASILQDLFGQFETDELHQLQSQLSWRHLSNGDKLFSQGDAADGMYIMVSGRLREKNAPSGSEHNTAVEYAAGDTVGEYALFTDDLRTTTVFAVRETDVVYLTKSVFEELTRQRPEWLRKIALTLVLRQQQLLNQTKPLPPTTLNIVLMPASQSVDTNMFARQLGAALEKSGSALLLDSSRFDELYGRPDASQTPPGAPENAAITAWIGEMEAKYTYLLFAADYSAGPWTERCINQADRVLIIANPAEDPAPGVAEQILTGVEVPLRTELVLWHSPATERPQGTSAWLDGRDLHSHHHIRQEDAGHMDRLARRLTGKAVGLALSGGSARGFAHLGVHRAIEELDIPIDYVGATSMGAVLGAAIVTTGSNRELMDVSKAAANPKVLFDRTLPLTSIMASKKVTQFTKDFFKDLRIEDQWIPFFCIATNITTAQRVIIQRGPLWRAVRSSMAIPGVFAPVIEDGEIIVDGNAMDNFPARLLAEFTESDRIIGVNVSRYKEKKRQYDFDSSISGWDILFSRLNPFAKGKRAPSIVSLILRTQEVNSAQRAREEEGYVDLMILPEIKRGRHVGIPEIRTDHPTWL